jgi:diguanylate cyclase (GGDEF)-like protein/PAS domain S-box-containing protein
MVTVDRGSGHRRRLRHWLSVGISLWRLLLLGALLLGLIWGTVLWEAQRIRQERLADFRQNLVHLAEILDETLTRQLAGIDNALLILRKDYVENKANLMRTVSLLRHGPLKGLDVYVTVIGRNGYSEFTDIPGHREPAYLGDRQHFRQFADGGGDQLYISAPVLGRITKRWGVQLARPILGPGGQFLGVIVIFLPPEELTEFFQPLGIGSDTIMSVFSHDGDLLSRSRDLRQHLGNRLSSRRMADYRRGRQGFAILRSAIDQVERGVAYRWVAAYPLLLVAARPPDAMEAEIRAAQRMLTFAGTGASLIVLALLAWVGRSQHLRERVEARLNHEHAHLVEAQRIAHLGSWEYNPTTDRWTWSDEVFRMFALERSAADVPARMLFAKVHPDDRSLVVRTYGRALKQRTAFDIRYRIQASNGRLLWLHARGDRRLDETGQVVMAGTVQDITASKEEEAAREALSRERLLLLESTGEGIYGIDLEGICTFVNQAASRMLGYTVAELIGRNIHALVHHKHADGSPYPLEDCPVYRTSLTGEAIQVGEDVFWRRNGTALPVTYSAQPIRDALQVSGTVVIFSDISERQRTEAEMRIAATAFETQEGIFITDAQGTILRVNSAFCAITGYTTNEAVGQNPNFRSSGRQDAAFFASMWERLLSTGAWRGEIWNRRKNGEVYPESITITAVRDATQAVSHYVATIHDITERKAREEAIQQLAFYDALTGLPNRRLLQDRLQQALATSSRSQHHGAVMFIDLDKFKQLNDHLGHDHGDLLLQQVALRLQDCVREADTVARLGGDEFVVLLQELSSSPPKANEQAGQVARKIMTSLNRPYDLRGTPYQCTPSIGATLFLGQQHSGEELLKQADLAMYRAKADGRNTLRIFSPDMLTPNEPPRGVPIRTRD